MSTPMLIMIAVGLAAVIGTLLALAAIFGGVQAYNNRVISISYVKLRNSFIGIGLQKLILMTIGGTLGLMTLGYLSMGVPGSVIGFIGGLVAPRLFQRYLIQRREAEFIYQLPDALRTMSGSLKSGGNIVRALEQVAQRQPKPICQEFQLVLQQYQLGRDLDEALHDLETRLNCDELQLLTAAISLSRSVGGNLGDSLEALAHTLQTKAQVEGKIRSMTATGRAQSWTMASLPILVGFALNLQEPKAMAHLFDEIYGWLTLFVVAFLTVVGFLVIRKIVNIDV
ncbi:MAG: type II secretion system F family protein [Halofilum sp. (in: g-proteobacteria)]|nr:type II secretion system F family protein [Halofilum sp. (in: g-proteobacteria)]